MVHLLARTDQPAMFTAAHVHEASGERTRPQSRAAPLAQAPQPQSQTRPATAATEVAPQYSDRPATGLRGHRRPASRGAYATTAAAADLYSSAHNSWYRNGGGHATPAAAAASGGSLSSRPRSGVRTHPSQSRKPVDPQVHAASVALTMGLSSAAGLALLATDPALVSASAASAANGAQSARPASSVHRQPQHPQQHQQQQQGESESSWAPTRPGTAPAQATPFYSPQPAWSALPKLVTPPVNEEKSSSPAFGYSMQARPKSRAGGGGGGHSLSSTDQVLRTLLLNASMLSSGAYCSFTPTPIQAVPSEPFSNAPLPRRAFVGIAGGGSRPNLQDGLRLANHGGPGTVQRLSRTLPPANQQFKPTYGITPAPPATPNQAGRGGTNIAQMLLRAQQAAASSPDAFLFRAPYSKHRGPYGYEHSKRIVASAVGDLESSHQSNRSSAGSLPKHTSERAEEVFDEEMLVGAEVLHIAAAPHRQLLTQIRASQIRADRARRAAEGGAGPGSATTSSSTVSLTREEEEQQYLQQQQAAAEESAALQRQLAALHRRSQSSMDMAQIEALRAQLKELPPPPPPTLAEAESTANVESTTAPPIVDESQQQRPRAGLHLLSPSQRAHFFASSRQRALDQAEASFQRSRSTSKRAMTTAAPAPGSAVEVESPGTERAGSKVHFVDEEPAHQVAAEGATAASASLASTNWPQWDSLNSSALSAVATKHARTRRKRNASAQAVDGNSSVVEEPVDSEMQSALDRLNRVILIQSLWRQRLAARRVRRRRSHLRQWVASEQQVGATDSAFLAEFLTSQGQGISAVGTLEDVAATAAVSASEADPAAVRNEAEPAVRTEGRNEAEQPSRSELEMMLDRNADPPSTSSNPSAAAASASTSASAGPSSREMSRKSSVSHNSAAAAAAVATSASTVASAVPTLRESKSRRKVQAGLTAQTGRSRSTTPRPDSSAAGASVVSIVAPPPLSRAAQLRQQLKAELEAEALLIRSMLLENAAKAQIHARHAEMARATRQAKGNHQLLHSLMNPSGSGGGSVLSNQQRRAAAAAAAASGPGSSSSVVSDDASDIGDALLDASDEVLYSELGLAPALPVSSQGPLLRKSSLGSMLDRSLLPVAATDADTYNAQLRKMGVTIDGSAESLRADQIGAGLADHIARWVTGFATSGAAAAAAKARSAAAAAATSASHRRNASSMSSSMTVHDADAGSSEIDMNFVSGASQLAGEGPLEPLPLSPEDQAFLQLEARNDALLVAALREAKQSPSEEERSRLRICQAEVALVLQREDSVILTQALARGRRARRQVQEMREKLGATKSAKQARLAAAEAARAEHERRRAAEEAARQEGILAARAAARALEEATQRKAQEDAAALALAQASERRTQEEEDARREAQAAAAIEADRVALMLASQHMDLETATELAELAPAHFVLNPASPEEMAAARLSSGRCDRCSNGRASLWCESCQLKLCDDLTGQGCDSELHFAADKIKHHRVAWPIQPTEASAAGETDPAALGLGIDRACTASPSASSTHRTHSSSYPHFIDNLGTMIRPPSASASASAHSRPQSAASPAPAAASAAATASSTKCDHCRRNQASIWCESCGKKYCDDLTSLSEGCDGTLHLIAANRGHRRVRWDPIKFPAGRPTTAAGSTHMHAPLAQVAESPRSTRGGAADLLLLDPALGITHVTEDARPLCDDCGVQKAFFKCGACQKRLCDKCDESLHAAGSAEASHERSAYLLQPPMTAGLSSAPLTPVVLLEVGSSLCDYCASSTKRVYCEACFMSLCTECEKELHATKSRAAHVRSKIEPDAGSSVASQHQSPPHHPLACDCCAAPKVDPAMLVWCESCAHRLCSDKCDAEVHLLEGRGAHIRTALPVPAFDELTQTVAATTAVRSPAQQHKVAHSVDVNAPGTGRSLHHNGRSVSFSPAPMPSKSKLPAAVGLDPAASVSAALPAAVAVADPAPSPPSSRSVSRSGAASSEHSPTSLSLQRKRTEFGLAPEPPRDRSVGAEIFPHAVATRWSNGSWRLEYPVFVSAPHLSPSPSQIRAGVIPFDPAVDTLTWNRKLYAALDLQCIIRTQCAWRQRQAIRRVRQVRNTQKALLGSRN